MAFTFEGQEDWKVPLAGSVYDFKLLQNYQESFSLYGLTLARDLGAGWSVGGAVYVQRYAYLSSIDLRGSNPDDPTVILQTTFRERRSPFNLVFMVGVLKQWNHWNAGLRISTPSLYVFGDGDYYEFFSTNISGMVDRQVKDLQSITAHFFTPLEIRGGTVFHPAGKWKFALDLSYTFPLQYRIFPGTELDVQEDTKGNVRLSGGMEFQFRDNLYFLGGASYTPTTLEKTEEVFGQNFWAVHLGGKLLTGKLESGAGFFYTVGKGEGPLPIGQGNTTEVFEYMGLIIGTNYRF